ncbi:MAG: dihydropteroate synthase [Planctomycetota bacterium]
MAAGTHHAFWTIGNGIELPLDRPIILGIVNLTPDSFSDGGELGSISAAVSRMQQLVEEGAAILDVGGESTRPGAVRIDPSEQIDRVVPVIKAARAAGISVPISIDTTRAAVAEAALDAGAQIVNDVAAGLEDDAMLPLVASRGVGVILMHRLRPPDQDVYSHQYDESPAYQDGIVAFVRAWLADRAAAARQAGVRREGIVLDPGLGFGKSVEQNLALVRSTPDLASLGYPLLSAASRKSFVGAISGVDEPADRIAGSVAISVAHLLAGVRLFRVHDVRAHAEALAVASGLGGTE